MRTEDIELLQTVKAAAKEELLPRFARVEREHKTDGSFVTEADYAVHNRLTEQLSSHWPEYALLSEEMSSSQQQQALSSGQPVWCLDPLDGTSNFAAGIPYFAVSLSLIEDGAIKFGLIYDPVRDECFVSQKNSVTQLNNRALRLPAAGIDLKQSTAIIDFKRLSDQLACRIIQEKPFSSQRNFGASALDWCWLAAGRG
ncbi:MAG: inositol monophosphatase family protein, partial [Gammaproteobacteria bacterium]|nr:inositol monophosphatase family protein [Gammaproteobacteria bacterium]